MTNPSAYLGEVWTDFFVTAAGASAALVGLVIVALSVNLRRIISRQQLPSLGAATIGALVLILVSSMAALIHQPIATLAIEILVFAIFVWLLQFWSARQMIVAYIESRRPLFESVITIAIGQIQVIPFILGGISLSKGHHAGAYWIAAGVIASFICSILNVWILLVEILR
ncbi:MAG: hypothetical protein WB586_28825 [Chthoniobacterales bacterium]